MNAEEKQKMCLTRYLNAVVVLSLILILAACTPIPGPIVPVTPTPEEPTPDPQDGEDPFNQINTALIQDAKVAEFSAREIPKDAFAYEPFEEKEVEEEKPGEEGPREKIHPVLMKWLAERPADERMLKVTKPLAKCQGLHSFWQGCVLLNSI